MGNEFLARNEKMLDGMYRLGAVIRRSVWSTVYETEFGEAALPSVIKIREIDAEASEDLPERWRDAMELEHPSLLKVYATGSSVFEGVLIAYVVMERADESLEGVLAERALTEDETREMLSPALQALQHLHTNGYAHSRLRASNVLAVGNQVKLSSDSVTRVEHGGSTAEDIKALGVLIVQALTLQSTTGDVIPDDFGHAPQPFPDIVRHCLDPDPDKRWTVEQVEARLRAPVVEPVSVIPEQQVEETSPVEMRSGVQAVEEPRREDRSTRGLPKWIYVALAALVLTVVLVAVMRDTDSAPVSAAPKATAPATPVAAVPESVPVPVSKPAPSTEATPAPPAAHGRKADGWSVIVAAYSSREPAEKRMREMAKKWPEFTVSVFQPQTGNTHYVVVLGQNLSEDQAEAMRKRAVDSGMPQDTYIKRVQ